MKKSKSVLTALISGLISIVFCTVAFSQTKSIIDQPKFASYGENFWGTSESEHSELTFRKTIININETGKALGDFIGVDAKTTYAEEKGGTQFICPEGAFPSAFDGTDNCYSCPVGYTQDPLFPADDERVCFKLDNFTSADKAGSAQFVCPAGQFPDLLLRNCYSCPSGTTHDPFIPVELPGACKANSTAAKQSGRAFACDSGHFLNASLTACYNCDSGYKHNPALLVDIDGVCWDSYEDRDCGTVWGVRVCTPYYPVFDYEKANKRYNLGCSSGDFSGGIEDPNGCYSCPSGTSHNPLLSINTPGVCFVNAAAKQEDSTTFICNVDEFLDFETGACFSCPTGYSHNPALPASVPGVCYEANYSKAGQDGTLGLICPVGQFLDVVTGKCYSCPDDYDWNPLVPVDENGSCVNWSSLDLDAENPAFEVGFKINADIKKIRGIKGGMTTDPGSIDINFEPRVQIDILPKSSDDGNEHYVIQMTQSIQDEDFTMSTIWPRVDMTYDPFYDEDYLVTGEYRGLKFNFDEFRWEQVVESGITLYDFSTNGEITMHDSEPLLHFGVGVSGIDLQVIGKGLENYTGGFDPGVELTQNFFTGSSDVVGTPIVEFGLTGPKMNTPPETTTDILNRDVNFKASFSEDFGLGENADNTYIKHSITASDRSGARIAVLGGSAQETDLLRLDLDLDGVASLLLTGGTTALGYKAAIPTPVPLFNYYSISASLIDADAAAILSFQEALKFHPNLETKLEFSVPVLLESVPGAGYERLKSIRISSGETVEIIHPGGDLTVNAVYTLDQNEFESDIDLMLLPLIEGEILSVEHKVLGLSKALLPKLTLVKLTQEVAPEPFKIADVNFQTPVFAVWRYENRVELFGLNHAQIQEKYKAELDIAEFSLKGFADEAGGNVIITGTHDKPVARCQDTAVSLDALGAASISLADIDNGSSDFNGGDLASLSLSQTEFNCLAFGIQTVDLFVLDDVGAEDSCSASVTVRDELAPIGILPERLVLQEGTVYNFDVDITDNCGKVAFQWTFPNGGVSRAASPTHQFCVLGEHTIDFFSDDGLGNTRSETIPVKVDNLAPVVDAGDEIFAIEGDNVQLQKAVFSDSGLFGHQAMIDWGEGNGFEAVTLDNPTALGECQFLDDVNAEHRYTQNGDYTIVLRITDAAGASHEDSTIAHIENQAPKITSIKTTARDEEFGEPANLYLYSGEALEFDLAFSDVGIYDAQVLSVDWQEVGVELSQLMIPATGVVSSHYIDQHIFYKPGQYNIKFTLEDEAGGTAEKILALEVKPLSVEIDFLPTDADNLIVEAIHGPVKLSIFAGAHELGDYSVEEIELDSLRLGVGEAEALHKIYDLIVVKFTGNVITQYADFNADEKTDLKVWFDAEASGISAQDRGITLTGQFVDGRYFEAHDRVNLAASRAEFAKVMNSILMLLLDD